MANSLAPPRLFVDTTATGFDGTCRIKAITIGNENGGVAKCTIYDALSATSQIILEVEMADQTSKHFYYGEEGIPMDVGIHVVVAANMHCMILMA